MLALQLDSLVWKIWLSKTYDDNCQFLLLITVHVLSTEWQRSVLYEVKLIIQIYVAIQSDSYIIITFIYILDFRKIMAFTIQGYIVYKGYPLLLVIAAP